MTIALAMGLFVTACSTDPVELVEAIETNDGAISVKPPDVLDGETDPANVDVTTATTAPIEPAEDTAEAPPEGAQELLALPANDFVWFDGTPGSTDDLLGTPTVLNFWSSNCAACVAEMPEFEQVAQEVAGRVDFVGMNRDDTREFALQLAEETGVTYPLAEDIGSAMFTSLRAFVMPTTVFLNEANEVAFVWQGTLTGEDLLLLIDEHLKPGNA